jgi:uncharacterized membrane protein
MDLDKEDNMNNKVKPTPLLWLVPIFIGLLGGILMYIAVKDQDQEKANSAILVGIVSTIVMIIVYGVIIMGAMMSSYRNMMGF